MRLCDLYSIQGKITNKFELWTATMGEYFYYKRVGKSAYDSPSVSLQFTLIINSLFNANKLQFFEIYVFTFVLHAQQPLRD